MFKSLVLVAILGWARLIWAEPQQCYDCQATKNCDDPVNTALIGTCHWLSNTQNTALTDLFDPSLFSKFNISVRPDQILKNPLAPVGDVTGKSCIKFILSDGSQKLTTRMCGGKYGNGKDICDYVKDTVDLQGLKFTCKTCDTNLCNSSSKISFSLLSCFGLIFFLYLLK